MGYLASGVTLEGTPLDVLEETAAEIEVDALNIRRTGQLEYQAGQAEATIERGLGQSALLKGRAARRAGIFGAIGTGLAGGASLGYQYGSMKGKW